MGPRAKRGRGTGARVGRDRVRSSKRCRTGCEASPVPPSRVRLAPVPRIRSVREGTPDREKADRGATFPVAIAPRGHGSRPAARSRRPAWRRAFAAFATVGALAAAIALAPSFRGSGTLVGCAPTTPVIRLATGSKYRADDPHKAALGARAERREDVMAPLRADVLAISRGAHGSADERGCAASALAAWARAGALGDMRSEDAMLSRSRLVAELMLGAMALDEAGSLDRGDRLAIARWGEGIARETARWFEREAGSVSRRNNHRLWAALAVGAAGRFAERPELMAWARASADVGLCAVDGDGLLPLELARGPRALRYHVYALRPLLALGRLDGGGDAPRPCPDALSRLTRAVAGMLDDPAPVAARAGAQQLPPAAASAFGPALRLPEELRGVLLAAR